MSNKKWDDGLLDDLQIVVLDAADLSGSNKTRSIDIQEEPGNKKTKVEVTVRKPKKNQSLIVPLEEYAGYMNPSEEKAYRDYKRQQFPELFDVQGLEDDKASEVPSLALTRPARIFATLLEAKMKEQEQELKNKVVH